MHAAMGETSSMSIEESLRVAFETFAPEGLTAFREQLPQAWIEEALEATGTATLRRRRLPSEQVVWLVLGMALMRDRPLAEIVRTLDIALPGRKTVAPSAIPQARARLGARPIEWLFEKTAERWTNTHAEGASWRGLTLYAVDGTTLQLPDTPAIREKFGSQTWGGGRTSAYPLLRLVLAVQLGTHLVRAAALESYGSSEQNLALTLRDDIPGGSLVIVDRGLTAAQLLLNLERAGSHWLRRAKSDNVWTVTKRLSPTDHLIEMKVSSGARGKDPSLPTTWPMRAITYKHGKEVRVLLTSLVDHKQYPAREIAALYRQRWEIELANGELKTDLQRSMPLRSKTTEGVEQEVWGCLLAYNLIRLEMARVAKRLRVVPTRISFVGALRLIVNEWMWSIVASPGAIPSRLIGLEENISSLVLPPRRERHFPRVVKVKAKQWPRKKTPVLN